MVLLQIVVAWNFIQARLILWIVRCESWYGNFVGSIKEVVRNNPNLCFRIFKPIIITTIFDSINKLIVTFKH